MGLTDFARKFFAPSSEGKTSKSTKEPADKTAPKAAPSAKSKSVDWLDEVPGRTPIGEGGGRNLLTIAGEVTSTQTSDAEAPADDFKGFSAHVSDGTGELALFWPGRSRVPGITEGSRIIAEGVLVNQNGENSGSSDPEVLTQGDPNGWLMIAPEYTLVARLGKDD